MPDLRHDTAPSGPTSPTAAASETSRARLRDDVAYWKRQLDSIERDRERLRYIPRAGCLLAALWLIFRPFFLEALGVVGLGLGVWAMGLYMTGVRLEEFSYRYREAQKDLDAT